MSKSISFKYYSLNRTGKDYVVSDIHGMFSALEDMLEQLQFDESKDRLFSLGDLIDRGAESARALEFINKPWFHAIMGNHEQMLLDSEFDEYLYDNWVRYNGGKWWKSVAAPLRDEFRKQLAELPIAIEIQTQRGQIGLLHADITPGYSWKEFVAGLDQDLSLREHALWSRERYKQHVRGAKIERIDGLYMLIFGHTPVEKPLIVENTVYLDTGAPYTHASDLAKLSMLEINPELKLHQISTKSKKGRTEKLWKSWLGSS